MKVRERGQGKVKVELPQLRAVIFLIKTKTAMHSRRWPRGVAATACARIGVGVGGAGAGGLQPERDIVYIWKYDPVPTPSAAPCR